MGESLLPAELQRRGLHFGAQSGIINEVDILRKQFAVLGRKTEFLSLAVGPVQRRTVNRVRFGRKQH